MTRTDIAALRETTTRRRVVKTGAKLVYAVPLVVASTRVSRIGASAQQVVSGTTWPGDDKTNLKEKQKDKPKNKPNDKPKAKPKDKGR